MNDNLSPNQFLHYTNHEFSPGDVVLPAAHIGLESQHQGNPDYRGDRVYLAQPDARHDPGWHHYGVHAYVVEPHGPVERDPEGVSMEAEYKSHGLAEDSVEMERARMQMSAPRATVVRHLMSSHLFGGSGSGMGEYQPTKKQLAHEDAVRWAVR